MSSKKYQKAYDLMTDQQKEAMYNLWMTGVNHDGHAWVTFADVENCVADIILSQDKKEDDENGKYTC